jgi:hypothetical protein
MTPRPSAAHDRRTHPCGWIGACLALAACGGPGTDRDGGVSDGGAADGPSSARVAVELSADLEGLQDDVVLERLEIGVVQIRAPNDRGELVRDVGLAIPLSAEPTELMLEGATPAVYGSVELDLGAGAWGPSFVMRVRDPERVVELTLDETVTLEGRCDAPVALAPGGRLLLGAHFEIGAIAESLREAELPEPVEGVVHVDRAVAPELVDRALERLRELQLDCDERD